MNIGLFNSTDTWGGGEKWYFEMAVYLAKAGYKVHFYLTRESELHRKLKPVKEVQLHFVNIGSLSFLNPAKLRDLRSEFISHRLDCLFIILSKDLKIAGRAATKAGINKIIYTRAVPIPIKNTPLNRHIFRHWVTHIMVNSKATGRSVIEKNPDLISEEKIKLIYNPVNTREFLSLNYAALYESDGNELVIGSAGRLEKEKNHRFFIALSKELKKSSIAHKILIAGAGGHEESLKEEARAGQVADTVQFVGFQENIKDLLMSCDVFVLPSLFEGFGFVIAEAALCELPVIAFDTTSVPELIRNGESGFVVEINSVAQTKEKLMFLKKNPEKAREMGMKGKQFIIENFDEEKIMSQLIEFIRHT